MIYKNREIIVLKSLEQIIGRAVEMWTGIAENAVKDRGFFTAALSGGRTPVRLYQTLGENTSLPWNRTHIFIVDERFVPFDHEDSNYRMINDTLLQHIKIPAEHIHPVTTEDDDPCYSAEKYEQDIISFFKKSGSNVPRFDLILLGLGDDGHTASLFPETPALKETLHLTASVTPPGKFKKERITLTFPAINNAEHIIFLVTGDSKAEVVREVIETDSSLPAAMVRPENGKLIFLLDKSAGSLLSG